MHRMNEKHIAATRGEVNRSSATRRQRIRTPHSPCDGTRELAGGYGGATPLELWALKCLRRCGIDLVVTGRTTPAVSWLE